MRRLSIIILSALLLIAFGGYVSAFDYGGSLSSATSLSTGTAGIDNEEALGLWLETGKGDHYSFEMKTDLITTFTEDGFQFFINPVYLKLDGLWDNLDYGPSIMATSIGRFKTSDFTTKIFSQRLDGVVLNFNYPAVELTISAGTTALMFSDTGSMLTTTPSTIMSKTDLKQKSDAAGLFEYLSDPTVTSLFDSPRAVEILTLTLPQVIAEQSITLSVVAQEDLRPMMEVINSYSGTASKYSLIQEGETTYYADRGGAVDTQYFGAGVSGSLVDSLYHNVFYYFGTGKTLSYVADPDSSTGSSYQYANILSHMAGFSLDYFMPRLFNSRISLSAAIGSGDADALSMYEGNSAGNYTQFTPVTGEGGGLIFSPGLSNIFSASLSYSLKPLEWLPVPFLSNIQASAGLMPFFKVTDGPIAVSGISSDFTEESGKYLGSEIDLSINMRPYSDLGVIVQAGYFLPNGDAFEGSPMADPTFMAKLNVSLSF